MFECGVWVYDKRCTLGTNHRIARFETLIECEKWAYSIKNRVNNCFGVRMKVNGDTVYRSFKLQRFHDIETDEIITTVQLYNEYMENFTPDERLEMTFTQYIINCTDKSGTLVKIREDVTK